MYIDIDIDMRCDDGVHGHPHGAPGTVKIPFTAKWDDPLQRWRPTTEYTTAVNRQSRLTSVILIIQTL